MMKLTPFLLFAFMIFILSFSVTNDIISNEGQYMQYDQVSMRFQGNDAVISVSYSLDMFSRMYVLLLGAYNLEPALDDFFLDFAEVEILEIGRDHAVVFASDVSRNNDAYYLHDSHELGSRVKVLTLVYPDGSTRSMSGVRSTPDTFYSG
ncbi:MAG: hypothetical protein QCH31_05480 [Methanolobus sp.]|nr:hypothetical protein [Methanolobus sp.]